MNDPNDSSGLRPQTLYQGPRASRGAGSLEIWVVSGASDDGRNCWMAQALHN